MIFRNAAECRLCGDTIESVHRHDFKYCKCGEIFVDGGKEYIRCGGKDLNNIIDRSEQEDWEIRELGAQVFYFWQNPFKDLEEFDFTLATVEADQ